MPSWNHLRIFPECISHECCSIDCQNTNRHYLCEVSVTSIDTIATEMEAQPCTCSEGIDKSRIVWSILHNLQHDQPSYCRKSEEVNQLPGLELSRKMQLKHQRTCEANGKANAVYIVIEM